MPYATKWGWLHRSTFINFHHDVLSRTIFLSKSLVSRFFLITSLIVFIGLPLPLIVCLLFIGSILLTTEFTGLLSIFPNHLSLFSTIFYTIGATPTVRGTSSDTYPISGTGTKYDILKKLRYGCIIVISLKYNCKYNIK